MITRLARPVAVGGTLIEALALLASAGWAVSVLVRGASAPAAAAALAGWAAILAVGLGFAARSLARSGAGLARGVVVTWQLVQAGSAGMIIGAQDTASAALVGSWLAAVLAVLVMMAAVADSALTHRRAAAEG